MQAFDDDEDVHASSTLMVPSTQSSRARRRELKEVILARFVSGYHIFPVHDIEHDEEEIHISLIDLELFREFSF